MAAPTRNEEKHMDPELENDKDSDGSDWEEAPDAEEKVTCLFCDGCFEGNWRVWQHCRDVHQIDINEIKATQNLDCFSYIKMVNYIRKHKPNVEEVKQLFKLNPAPWLDDAYMNPTDVGDYMLFFDVEDVEATQECVAAANGADASVHMTDADQHLLEARLQAMEEHNKETTEAMLKMKDLTQMLLSNLEGPAPSHEAVHCLTNEEDDAYISSYSHFSIHEEMLKDTVRTETYRKAIMGNSEFFRNKVVLDIGCGTGILSMFAARAGAKQVVAVEMSDIAYQAIDIIKENKLDDKIVVVKGRLEDVEMPVDQFDVIISEWMGYFLLFESMLDSVLYARDRWLKPDGIILPDSCDLYLVGLADEDVHRQHLKFWDNVYGFKMSCMKQAVLSEASVAAVNGDKVATSKSLLKKLPIQKCNTKDVEFTSPFCITATRACELTALVGYFDTFFHSLENQVDFSTSPIAKLTHWKQTVFVLHNPISLKEGQTLEGQLMCRKNRKDPRSLIIHITIDSNTYKYLVQ